MLLIHGVRAVLCHAKTKTAVPDRLRGWALKLEQGQGHNKAAVALANKLACIAVGRLEDRAAVRGRRRLKLPSPRCGRSPTNCSESDVMANRF
jgi:hypothetical protein